MYGPLLFGLLVALAVVIGFAAGWRILRTSDPVEARLQEFETLRTAVADSGNQR